MSAQYRFGAIEPYQPGDCFPTRLALSASGLHRPIRSGISGSPDEGVASIVLAGGYEDNEDYWSEIIYTGQGGRNYQTKQQITDQLLSRSNQALAQNITNQRAVRVIRGWNAASHYSPTVEEGYRYDGLYRVVEYWPATGKAGFRVWRYRLVMIID